MRPSAGYIGRGVIDQSADGASATVNQNGILNRSSINQSAAASADVAQAARRETQAVEGRIVAHQRATPAWQCTLRLTARTDAGAIAAIVEVRMLESETASN